jgi:hypothetical protein
VHRAIACACAGVSAIRALADVTATPAVHDPVWRREFAADIEWIAPAGALPDAPLLIATADGVVRCLDAASGAPAISEPIAARPGVRLAPGVSPLQPAGEVVYLVDRYQVRALETCAATVAVRWTVGDRPADAEERIARTDPEFLPTVVAQHATERGLLLLRDDGTLALLSAADGHVISSSVLAPARQAELRVRGGVAYLVETSAGALTVWSVLEDSEVVAPSPAALLLDGWPLWCGASTCGLIVATAASLHLVQPRAYAWRLDADTSDSLAASQWALGDSGSPAPSSEGSAVAAQELLWSVGSEATVTVRRVADGSTVWCRAAPPHQRRAAATRTRIDGSRLTAWSGSFCTVLESTCGENRGFLARERGLLLAAQQRGPSLLALSSEPQTAPPSERRLMLVKTADERPSGGDGVMTLSGAPTDEAELLDVQWRAGVVVLATRRACLAYAMP